DTDDKNQRVKLSLVFFVPWSLWVFLSCCLQIMILCHRGGFYFYFYFYFLNEHFSPDILGFGPSKPIIMKNENFSLKI
ncbi:MAG: hypothetical protein MCS20_01780, partial [Candidatus Phytoplasma mali]|nr:hypothetical protein [Candidatus Phytoplasma mali]